MMPHAYAASSIVQRRAAVRESARHYNHKESVRFLMLPFDCLRFWTTLHFQIYARKTHANTWACINRTWKCNCWKCPVFKQSSWAYYAISWRSLAPVIMSFNVTAFFTLSVPAVTFCAAKLRIIFDICKKKVTFSLKNLVNWKKSSTFVAANGD